MKTFILFIVCLTLFVMLYVTWLRPRLKRSQRGQRILAAIEPFERIVYWNSESMLWNRFKAALGAVLTTLVAFDWSAVSPILPEKLRPFAMAAPTIFLAIDGLIGEKLRRNTTKPLEVVAMRTDAPAEAKAAAAIATSATAEAVAIAKQTGAV